MGDLAQVVLAGNLLRDMRLARAPDGIEGSNVVCVSEAHIAGGRAVEETLRVPIIATGPSALLLTRRYVAGDRVCLLGRLSSRGGRLIVLVEQDLGASPGGAAASAAPEDAPLNPRGYAEDADDPVGQQKGAAMADTARRGDDFG